MKIGVHRPLLKAVLAVVRHPRVTLLVAGAVLAVCVLLAVFRLPISTDQDKLFNRDVPFFRDYLEFDRKFPENEAVVVVVRPKDATHPPAVERWTAAADSIAARAARLTKAVERVDAKVPLEQLGSQGILFEETARLPERVAEVKRFGPLAQLWGEPPGLATRFLGGTPLERFLGALNAEQALAATGARASDAETASFVTALAASWNRALVDPKLPMRAGQGLPDLARLGAETPADLGYYYVRNEDPNDPAKYLLIVQVYPKENYTALTAVSETVEAIRGAVNEAAKEFPEFKVGVTGRPALEADEMRTTDRDSNRAEVIALIAVFIGIAVVLRSLWLALAAEICLGVGIGWTFGWATISVGELNLLSIVFLIALIGIGMDYLVQILTRYRQEAGRRGNPRTIWLAVFKHVGPPINTACMGAAGAFLVAWLTRRRFQGAADLGIVAGGGLLLCLLSGYTVLPALLTLLPGRRRARKGPTPSPLYSGERAGVRGRLSKWRLDPDPPKTWRRRLILPLLWVLVLVALAPQYRKARFDPGLLNLQAPHLESVQLVHKLQTWSAVVLSKDLKVLREARAVLEPSPTVGRTESILQAYDNYDWLHQHAGELPQIQWTDPTPIPPNDLTSIADKARTLAGHYAAAASKAQTRPAAATDLANAARELQTFAGRLSAIANDGGTSDGAARRLSEWQTAFVAELREMLGQFNPRPLELDRVPRELRSHFVSVDGTYALWTYPKLDLWNRQNLEQFVRDVERRARQYPGLPKPTGIAINIYHTTDAIRGAFFLDTMYALALIVLLVFIDLRRIDQTLMAVSVLGFGLLLLLGLMVLLDRAAARGWLEWLDVQEVSWNFANFFALPILIGAGHEYGVFMVHRYREALLDPRRAWRGWEVSDWALLLCAYITSTSFGFFGILADHRGLKSLGLVMALGTACIYLATIAVLRPVLKWRLARIRFERQDAKTPR